MPRVATECIKMQHQGRHIALVRQGAVVNTLYSRSEAASSRSAWGTAGLAVLRGVGHLLRLIVFAPLAILEPVIRVVLSTLAVLGFATCAFYKLAGPAHHFPFGLMIGFSVGCSVLLVLYYMLMRALAP
jgi:hypothetical protein